MGSINSAKMAVTSLITLARALKHYHKRSCLPAIEGASDEVHILGNGPSLNASLEKDRLGKFADKDCICVNDFVESDYYRVIKPKYYVFMDPVYWEQDCLQALAETRERVLSTIALKTTWKLTILLPAVAKRSETWRNRFIDHPHIEICFFNASVREGNEEVLHYLYKQNLAMPHAQNVLIAATFLAINIGYRSVYLHGADHSWHEDLVVDSNNVVCLKDRHFYDDDEVELTPWRKGDSSGTTWKMHEILQALSKMFEGYYAMSKYAQYRNASIYNASIKTAIDAFPRCRW